MHGSGLDSLVIENVLDLRIPFRKGFDLVEVGELIREVFQLGVRQRFLLFRLGLVEC